MFRNLAGLLNAALMLAVAVDSGSAQQPRAQESADFYHTAWDGVGAVFDVKQSLDGFLWLTTSKGVLRFDGVRFQSVEEATFGAVRANEIDSVFISSNGGLWFTTEGAGLLFWKDGKLTEFPDRRCTPTRKQGKLVEDRDGSLWVQGAAGLFHLRGNTCDAIGAKQGYPGGFAAGIFLDSRGTLWVKTRKGPLLFLPAGKTEFRVNESVEGVSTSYAFLHEASDGSIWLSDDQGLRRAAGRPGEEDSTPRHGEAEGRKSQFGDFAFAADGSLWAVNDQGVKRFHDIAQWPAPVATENAPGQVFTSATGLSSDAVWKVMIDREGVAWVGTNSGLDRLRRNVFSTVPLPHAQEHEFALAPGDQGSLWIGNSSLPLTRIGPGGEIARSFKTVQPISIRRDHNGTMWAAGTGDAHLWRSSGSGFSPVHYPDEDLDAVVSVATDRNDEPWILTRGGKVYHFSNGAWSNQNKALGRRPGVIGTMADDSSGNVWIAFSNKVAQWDGSAYHTFVCDARTVSQNTMSIRDDRVWMGGSGGVQLFRGRSFHNIRWKDQDLPGRVSGLIETETGDLWINGFSGVTHVPAAELSNWLSDPGYSVSAEHLDQQDGLPGLSGEKIPEPSVVESPDGRLWFATTKGVASLDPARLAKGRNKLAPPVQISAVLSNGKVYPASSELRLPARTENLEIDYTALSLAMPERVLFRYQLAGIDREWESVGTRRQAYYTKLRPGRYKFRVSARNNDGVWNQAGAALNFDIAPAWFQTSWFRVLLVTSGLALASLLYRLRVRHIASGIYARFEARMAERTRIAQELHDTLLQGFLSASMQVHVATDALPDDSSVKPTLTRALELMRQVIDEGRNAVRGLRASGSSSLDLELAFSQIQQEVVDTRMSGDEIDFRVIVEGEQRTLHPVLRDELYRIGREALLNAFRHAHASKIELELKYSTARLEMIVRDDGRGIDPRVLQTGRDGHWGLSGMRERADRIGASLHVMSNASAGTEVELSVPGKVAFQSEDNGNQHKSRRVPVIPGRMGD